MVFRQSYQLQSIHLSLNICVTNFLPQKFQNVSMALSEKGMSIPETRQPIIIAFCLYLKQTNDFWTRSLAEYESFFNYFAL